MFDICLGNLLISKHKHSQDKFKNKVAYFSLKYGSTTAIKSMAIIYLYLGTYILLSPQALTPQCLQQYSILWLSKAYKTSSLGLKLLRPHASSLQKLHAHPKRENDNIRVFCE